MADSAPAAEKDLSDQFVQARKKRRRNRIVAVLAVVAIAGGYYYWTTTQNDTSQQDELLIVTINYGNIENAIPTSGTLQPSDTVPIGARASGELTDIYVEEGDYVEEGQELAQIDASEQVLRVDRSKLSLKNQENQLTQRQYALDIADTDYNRTLDLFEQDAATKQDLERAQNSLYQAEQSLESLRIQIEQSKTDLQQEEVQLRYTTITAPFSGTIISLDQKEGATLNASQTAPTVMQIADLTTLTVEVEISEADIAALDVGTPLYFTTLATGDRRWYGELRKRNPLARVNNNVVLYTGSFDVDNSDGELFPGMTTQVFFVISEARNVLTVPLGALTFLDSPRSQQMTNQQGGPENREEMAALAEQFRQGGGDMTPEMRARVEQFRQGGGFDGGGFAGGRGGRGGRGNAQGGGGLAGSVALNEPRDATVRLVQDDGSIVTREVVVGITDRVNAEVISGLERGDRVVAGVIQASLEEEQNNNNNNNNNNWRGNNNNWRGGGGFPF